MPGSFSQSEDFGHEYGRRTQNFSPSKCPLKIVFKLSFARSLSSSLPLTVLLTDSSSHKQAPLRRKEVWVIVSFQWAGTLLDYRPDRAPERFHPPHTNYMFTSAPTVFKLYFYSKREADFLSLPVRVRIVICTELGGRLLGARIPGLFFWCLLNVSVSCGGKAGDESSCVNNLWHIPC